MQCRDSRCARKTIQPQSTVKKINHLLSSGLFAGITAALAGCASIDGNPSGFLENPEQMRPEKPNDPTSYYCDAGSVGRYQAIIVEPVSFQARAASRLEDAERVRLGGSLTKVARETFGTMYAIAQEPSPDALRLRVTVSDINKSSPTLNLVTAAIAFVPLDAGAISVEMEVVDSVNGTRVAAFVTSSRGVPIAPDGFFQSFSPTGHAQAEFEKATRAFLKIITRPEAVRTAMVHSPKIDGGSETVPPVSH